VAIHVITRRLGHASIETTSRYLAEVADDTGAVGEVLDRRHQRAIRLTPGLCSCAPGFSGVDP